MQFPNQRLVSSNTLHAGRIRYAILEVNVADFITANTFEDRLRQAITSAWAIFARKVGGDLIPVNKEASMQLQYAYILQQLLPLTSHAVHETAEIELETGVRTSGGTNEIDILLKGESSNRQHLIAIELKCYRKLASSGGPRGAQDIFMKDVYADLAILEEYVSLGIAHRGVALVMNDHEMFVNPKRKTGKCWDYDISHGFRTPGGLLDTPIGGKEISIRLGKAYSFNWSKFGNFWFMELEGAGQSFSKTTDSGALQVSREVPSRPLWTEADASKSINSE